MSEIASLLAPTPAVLDAQQVARVLIEDVPAHLAKTFDYSIPAGMHIAVGMPVQVHLHGARKTAWVVEIGEGSEFSLRPLDRALAPFALLSESTLALCQQLAQRYAIAPVELFSLAAGNRHQATLKRAATKLDAQREAAKTIASPSANHANSPARLVFDLPPVAAQLWCEAIVALLEGECRTGKTLIVVPTQSHIAQLQSALKSADIAVLALENEATEAEKTATQLAFRYGEARVLLGTRNAVWCESHDLTNIIIWDYENEQYWPQRHPRIDSLTVAMQRSLQVGYNLYLLGYVRSLRAQMLLQSGFAKVGNIQTLVSQHIPAKRPRRYLSTPDSDSVQGRFRREMLPLIATKLLQKLRAKAHATALIVVPRKGFITAIACSQCRKKAICQQCGTNLRPNQAGDLYCPRCRSLPLAPVCSCGATINRPVRMGAQQIRAELSRSFPQWQVELAGMSDDNTRAEAAANPQGHRIRVATQLEIQTLVGSYDLSVFMEADNLERTGALWAELTTLNRIEMTVALTDAAGACIVVDGSEKLNRDYLQHHYEQRAAAELAERKELGLWPTHRIIRFTQDTPAVSAVCNKIAELVTGAGGNCLRGSLPTAQGELAPQLAISIPQAQAATTLLWKEKQIASAADNDFYYQVDPR